MGQFFTHRLNNRDGMVESICHGCFQTVGTAIQDPIWKPLSKDMLVIRSKNCVSNCEPKRRTTVNLARNLQSIPMPDKARVFVVDDEQIIADTFAMILNQSGFDAVPLYNGPDAIALCRRKPCDVLLTDVMMNPMNGVDTALAIRQICPVCKVLLFSGNPDTANLLNIAQADGYAFEVLAKPLHPVDVIKRVASLIEG